jgi:lipopolysaccharide export system permease protein
VFGGVLIGISFFLLNNVFGYIGNLQQLVALAGGGGAGLIYTLLSLAPSAGWCLRR